MQTYGGGGAGGFRAPRLSPVNKVLVITVVVVFLIDSALSKFSGISLQGILGLSSYMFNHGHIYELITYPFLGRGLLEVVFNALLFWFIGADLEDLWKKSGYLKFLIVSAVGGGLIYVLITTFLTAPVMKALPLTGMSGVVSALLLGYAILFPNREFLFMFVIPVKAKYFCMILVGMQMYMGVFTPYGVLAWGHLGAMLSAFLYMLYSSRSRSLFSMNPDASSSLPKKSKKSHLKLVDEDETPKYWH